MKKQFRIFISSVQDEFAAERKLLKKWLTTDPFVSRFVEKVFLFEDVPSRGKSPVEVFLDEVRASDIYIGLLGVQYYGKRSVPRGVSATEREYAEAVKCGCERFVYLKACDARDKKEQSFVRRVNREVTRTLFNDFNDLKTAVYSSLVEFLDARELIEVGDFDKSACAAMADADVDTERVQWYLREMSYRKKKAALPLTTTPQELMEHLGILKDGVYTWAAALCFAKNPQRWCYRATLKCSWCEGREFTRPFLDADKFDGNLFELQKTGVDFVMSRIAQSRGLRETGMQASVRAEIPREAVEEALVNALVHRDWKLSASVEIRLFVDRVEIWTPGKLPEGLTIEKLFKTHTSFPVNDLVLKTFDFAGLIESLGTGIKRMVDACKKNKNPIPEFRQEGAMFVVTLKKKVAARRKTTKLKTTLKARLKTTQETTQETTQQTTQETTQEAVAIRVLQGVLRGNALRVALYLLQNPRTKIEKIMQEIELTRDGVNYHLRQLKATVGLCRDGALQDSIWKFNFPKRLLRGLGNNRGTADERL